MLFIIFGVLLCFAPLSIGGARQANFISKWNEMYNKVDYMFHVINAHITDDIFLSFKTADTQKREQLMIALIKPYLRVNTDIAVPRQYKPKYMNKTKVYKGQTYYFDDLFFTENNKIVGIKDLSAETGNPVAFILMFDINGLIPPNTWGKDIFGINILEDGRIEAFGQNLDMDSLRRDCSASGSGIGCSYYYKIGGGF